MKKFYAVIGNPPYNEDSDTYNRQPPIYPEFYDEVEQISDKSELITPARFLFNAGLTSKEWNRKMLNDKHLKVEYYEPDSDNVFPSLATPIKGGVAIIYRDKTKEFGAIGEFISNEHLRKIASHFVKDESTSLSSVMMGGRSDLKFNDVFIEDYPDSIKWRLDAIKEKHPEVEKLGTNEEYELKSSSFEVLEKAFIEDKPSNESEYYKIIGLYNKKRVYRWIPKKYMVPRYAENNLNCYKLFISKAFGDGQFGETLGDVVIAAPGVSATPTFIGIGSFSTEREAINASKYIKSKLVRALVGILKITQDNVPSKWAYVPMQDFSDQSDINWNLSIHDIDKQLYQKYGLDDADVSYIDNNVKEMT